MNLSSLKGVIRGMKKGTTIGVIKGDTGSLDYSSYGLRFGLRFVLFKRVSHNWVSRSVGPHKRNQPIVTVQNWEPAVEVQVMGSGPCNEYLLGVIVHYAN